MYRKSIYFYFFADMANFSQAVNLFCIFMTSLRRYVYNIYIGLGHNVSLAHFSMSATATFESTAVHIAEQLPD